MRDFSVTPLRSCADVKRVRTVPRLGGACMHVTTSLAVKGTVQGVSLACAVPVPEVVRHIYIRIDAV